MNNKFISIMTDRIVREFDPLQIILWAVEAHYPERTREATTADASKAVEQARAIWPSVSTALAERGYQAEQD